MKFVIAIVALMFGAGCGVKYDTRTVCAHPAIMMGMAFELPPSATYTTNGAILIKQPDGTVITLRGAVCITTATPKVK